MQCGGDSGGPLFVNMSPDKNGNERFRLIGINSATVGVGSEDFGCGSNNNLHVHANVLQYSQDITDCRKGTCDPNVWVSWQITG